MSQVKTIAILLAASCFIGVGLSGIPWGRESGFHGNGFPFPVVMWDRHPTTGQLVPYSSLLGAVLNIAVCFILAACIWFILRRVKRRSSV